MYDEDQFLLFQDYIGMYIEKGIPTIPSDIAFWMVRSKSGYFYEEFRKNEYMAIGWNCIEKHTDLNSSALPEILVQNHDFVKKDKRQIKIIINKCNAFINEMKENDIVLIPKKSSSEIMVALVGAYYEDSQKTCDDENKINHEIDTVHEEPFRGDCPYKKRRKIKILRIVTPEKINFHLMQALKNYNGIADISKYSTDILNLVFDFYIFKENLFYAFEVNRKERIPLKYIVSLLAGTSEYFNHKVEEDKVKIKVNLNSPGTIEIMIEQIQTLIAQYGVGIVIIFAAFVLVGNICTKVDFPKRILDMITIPSRYRMQRMEEEKMRLSLDKEKKEWELLRNSLNQEDERTLVLLLEANQQLEIEAKEKDLAENAKDNLEVFHPDKDNG